jgi:hypothetical protein
MTLSVAIDISFEGGGKDFGRPVLTPNFDGRHPNTNFTVGRCVINLTQLWSNMEEAQFRKLVQGRRLGRHPARQLSLQVPPCRPRSSVPLINPEQSYGLVKCTSPTSWGWTEIACMMARNFSVSSASALPKGSAVDRVITLRLFMMLLLLEMTRAESALRG